MSIQIFQQLPPVLSIMHKCLTYMFKSFVSPVHIYLINFSAMDCESQKRNSFDLGMLNIGQPGTDCKKTVVITLLIDLLYLWKRMLWRESFG